jgi:glyoxalase family protein
MDPSGLLGLHHVTALAGDPQRNLDFYTRVLGLRLVKRTVNFDDPGAYHFYFSTTAEGAPGTLLTFFPWPRGRQGKRGSGQITGVSLGLPYKEPGIISDPDGIEIEVVPGCAHLKKVTIASAAPSETMGFFENVLGLPDVIHVVSAVDEPRGRMAAGIIHHVACRTQDRDTQLAWREKLVRAGLRVSPVKDRLYFESIYFREPGGVLLEIATDGPGFGIDEPADQLGRRLCLPPWFEPIRESIERRLPPLILPQPEDVLA